MLTKIKNFITNHFNVTAFILFTIVVFSLYGRTISFDFSYYDDDVLVLDRQDYLSFSNIKNIVSNTVFGVGADKFCRPVLNLTFLCEKYLYGIKPFGYHLTNIMIHLLAVFGIYLFLSLLYDKKKTFILCLLFACHPAIVQAVAWIPGRNDSLLTLFVAFSFYFFIKYADENKISYLFCYLICFGVSLFTKETAVFIPVFYFLLLVYKNKNIKKIVVSVTIWLLVIALYLLYRKYVLSYQPFSTNFKALLNNFITAFPATTKYVANIFFPIKLSVFPSMLEVNYLLCITTILTFVLLFLKFKFYDLKFVLFGIFWFFLFLFPTFLMPNNCFYDHRIYLPLIGALIIVLEITKSYNNILSKKFMAITFCVFLLFSAITIFYEQKFENKEVFWLNALDISPDSDIPHAVIGRFLMEGGFYKEAEEQILTAISIKEDSKHYGNLAVLYARMGDLDKMEEPLLKALELAKDNPLTYYNLALFYKYKGDKEKAQEMKNKYIQVFNMTNKVSKMADIDL
ncbi:MAG: glycosyltransferase family 39 protein [Elusimicrobia bacterium]|nr:glycosyltransferase family 39 protein [Elusimicrobiota bacterium]